MVRGVTKKIVILKDIPSNLIEEAILILKNDYDIKNCSDMGKLSLAKELPNNGKKGRDDYLLNEAQLIIDNYIKECKQQAELRRDAERNRNKLKKLFSLNTVINIVLTSSIILFILLLSKLLFGLEVL